MPKTWQIVLAIKTDTLEYLIFLCIYYSCSKEIPMVVLLKFVSEGDNIPDALGLVEYLNEWLQIIKPCVSFTTFKPLISPVMYL